MSDALPDQPRELLGKTAVVTGASSGIGRAIAWRLARGGADVLVHARANRDGAEELAEQIRSLGQRSEVLLSDFEPEGSHEEFVERAWAWRGGVDVWINNAGADVLTGDAAELTFDQKLDILWRVDARGAIRLARCVGGKMRKASQEPGDRVILNMGWDQALSGMAGDSGEMFSAVKGAVMAFSQSLARSLAPRVRVNCLAPGWIRTAWGAQASSDWRERARGESLLERWGEPDDVAQMARFLCSPRAAFITGQIFAVNGGSARD